MEAVHPIPASRTQQARGGLPVHGGRATGAGAPQVTVLKVPMAADRTVQPSCGSHVTVTFGSGWQLTSRHAEIRPSALTSGA